MPDLEDAKKVAIKKLTQIRDIREFVLIIGRLNPVIDYVDYCIHSDNPRRLVSAGLARRDQLNSERRGVKDG